ncbi:MAG: hypothetical protein AAF734_04000, partial [Bacteroidota bacterium]
MKAIKNLLVGFFLFFSIAMQAQSDYFYYYGDKKIPLTLNTEYYFVSLNQPLSPAALEERLGGEVKVVEDILFGENKELPDQIIITYWAEVKVQQPLTQEEYQQQIVDISNLPEIEVATPYFRHKDQSKIRLANLFYIKLKSVDDEELLYSTAEEYNLEVLEQNKFMPLWY